MNDLPPNGDSAERVLQRLKEERVARLHYLVEMNYEIARLVGDDDQELTHLARLVAHRLTKYADAIEARPL